MKEKSSSLSAGQASDGGGPSGPSVDSSSELERSTLELRRSLELSRCSTDVDSVYEDRRLLGGCFPTEAALLSGDDGDSGPKLHRRQETTALTEGPRTLNPKPGVVDTWRRVFRLRGQQGSSSQQQWPGDTCTGGKGEPRAKPGVMAAHLESLGKEAEAGESGVGDQPGLCKQPPVPPLKKEREIKQNKSEGQNELWGGVG